MLLRSLTWTVATPQAVAWMRAKHTRHKEGITSHHTDMATRHILNMNIVHLIVQGKVLCHVVLVVTPLEPGSFLKSFLRILLKSLAPYCK